MYINRGTLSRAFEVLYNFLLDLFTNITWIKTKLVFLMESKMFKNVSFCSLVINHSAMS